LYHNDDDHDNKPVWPTWAVDDDDDDDDDNTPVWPTWAVGALFRGVRRIRINHVCFHIPPCHGGVGTSSLRAESTLLYEDWNALD